MLTDEQHRADEPTAPSVDASNPLGLPERVRVISLWGRWAEAVAAGIKTIETRRWQWKGPPGWLAIHAGLKWDQDGGFAEQPGDRVQPFPAAPRVQAGALCALVWVAGCRPLAEEDKSRALLYMPRLYAWPLERVRRLRPVPMRGPQKFSSVPREVILGALEQEVSR